MKLIAIKKKFFLNYTLTYSPHILQISSLTQRPLALKGIQVVSNHIILKVGKLRPRPGKAVEAGRLLCPRALIRGGQPTTPILWVAGGLGWGIAWGAPLHGARLEYRGE